MTLFPERLVTVGTFGSPELAAAELEKLRDAGLDAYLGGTYFRRHGSVQLQVPESQIEKARALLGIEPAETVPEIKEEPRAERAVCPDCGSADSFRIPPYAFRVLVASVAVALVTFVLGVGAIGATAVVLGWILAAWLSRYSGKYRCRRCGRDWKPA